MKRWKRITITALVFAAAAGVAMTKQSVQTKAEPNQYGEAASGKPRFLELGSTTCTQCKMMKKVIAALRRDYPDSLQTDFIDVALDVGAGKAHGIKMIPTQIFFDASGRELYRHEGYISEEDVVATFAEHDIELQPAGEPENAASATSRTSGANPVERTFAWLTQGLEGTVLVALGAAFVWGILSVLLSPCHLASIPLVVGFINDQDSAMTTKRAFGLASLFSIGILITIAVIGAVTAFAGRLWGDVGLIGTIPVVVIFLLMGLHLLGIVPMPINGPGQTSMRRRGFLAAFILGLVFGVALGPCTFAFMAPILGLVFNMGAGQTIVAAGLLVAYGIGHCGVIVFAGTFTESVQRYMNWTGQSPVVARLKQVCGVMVILGGFFMVWKAF